MNYNISHCILSFATDLTEPPKIDDNVSNSPPQQRKVIAGSIMAVCNHLIPFITSVMLGPAVSPATTPSKPSSSKSNILSSIFRNKVLHTKVYLSITINCVMLKGWTNSIYEAQKDNFSRNICSSWSTFKRPT